MTSTCYQITLIAHSIFRAPPGGRYSIDPAQGLFISDITEEDNGLYQCRAEVVSLGSFDKVYISVIVHSECEFVT